MIEIFEEDVTHQLADEQQTIDWITTVVQKEGYLIDHINYIFCSDQYLLSINQKYLDHDTYTDIITFDNSDEEGSIQSDIFVSIPRVFENAKLHDTTIPKELHRVMIHGVLHLCGFKDKTSEEATLMRQKENEALTLLYKNI